MKRIVLTLCVLVTNFICSAQVFQVYTVKGDVYLKKGDNMEKIVSGMLLQSSSAIVIREDGRLVVLSENEKKLYTMKKPQSGTLGALILKNENTPQHLTETYLKFIKQKITESEDGKEKNYKQTAGVSYRDADSLLLKKIIQERKNESNRF